MYNPYKLLLKWSGNKSIWIFTILSCWPLFIKAQDSTPKYDDRKDPLIGTTIKEQAISSVIVKKTIFYFVKEAPNDTYGFDIYVDGKVVMDQSNVPGRNATNGFRSIVSAENVAKYLVDKMRSGEGKIEVTEEVLKKLIVD
jgi:hypothetical protein